MLKFNITYITNDIYYIITFIISYLPINSLRITSFTWTFFFLRLISSIFVATKTTKKKNYRFNSNRAAVLIWTSHYRKYVRMEEHLTILWWMHTQTRQAQKSAHNHQYYWNIRSVESSHTGARVISLSASHSRQFVKFQTE